VPQTGISKLDPAQELVMHKEFLKAACRNSRNKTFKSTIFALHPRCEMTPITFEVQNNIGRVHTTPAFCKIGCRT
jgi:hypothetical protein